MLDDGPIREWLRLLSLSDCLPSANDRLGPGVLQVAKEW